ncbi:hypothetical protein [Opitutus sp. GAS368]|jgi:hypothetical protein|uniref:hypothetical protein n=1 Tax=Opitutus sp. GAS368 TaxID=1882749 RepID=UPI00087C7FD7|nr:hypothetical protein [Opitutus sp. GAS368]SDS02804.1 hypothetical protein SAMN05444173_1669 [Opitutus sp. GAS368]
MSQVTFDQVFVRELGKQRESGFNTKVCVAFGAVSIPLAIFSHPAWLAVTALAALFYWFHRSMYGGDHDLMNPAARQACEFMVQVRQSGHARSLMPLTGVVTIMRLALSEYCANDSRAGAKNQAPDQVVWPGARIARNLTVTCAHCQHTADRSVTGAWWAAKAAFKPFTDRARYLRPDGTCAKCGNIEGWFESCHP